MTQRLYSPADNSGEPGAHQTPSRPQTAGGSTPSAPRPSWLRRFVSSRFRPFHSRSVQASAYESATQGAAPTFVPSLAQIPTDNSRPATSRDITPENNDRHIFGSAERTRGARRAPLIHPLRMNPPRTFVERPTSGISPQVSAVFARARDSYISQAEDSFTSKAEDSVTSQVQDSATAHVRTSITSQARDSLLYPTSTTAVDTTVSSEEFPIRPGRSYSAAEGIPVPSPPHSETSSADFDSNDIAEYSHTSSHRRRTAPRQSVALLVHEMLVDDAEEDCPICHERPASGDMIITMRCGHTFCSEYLEHWLFNQARTCPTFRTDTDAGRWSATQ